MIDKKWLKCNIANPKIAELWLTKIILKSSNYELNRKTELRMAFNVNLKKKLEKSVVSIENEARTLRCRDLVWILRFWRAVCKIEINALWIIGNPCAKHHLS